MNLGKTLELLAIALLAFALGGCAIAPATISRVTELGGCSLGKHAPEELLRLALSEPNQGESAHALAHFVESWHRRHPEENSRVFTVGNERYRVRLDAGSHRGYSLAYFDEVSPAIDFRVKRIPHHRRDGIGAPLVALRENQGRETIETFYPPEAITRPLTALIEKRETNSEGEREISVELLCPLQHPEIRSPEIHAALAADFSVPWANLLSRAGYLNRLRFFDALRTDPKRDPSLYLMEPYDPRKEPLIMIHGLLDTPLVWAELSNELWAEDAIRERYQIWHYLYNTSAPALYSGRLLQQELRNLRKQLDPEGDDPAMQSTTLIAHSMGGIVSRRLTTEPGDVFWEAAFHVPFEELDLSPEDRDSLKEAFFWKAEPHIKRIIYVAVPHQGSDYADNFIGQLGTVLVKPPNRFAAFYSRISSANPGVFTDRYAALGRGELDSVNALSPKQPSLPILAALPNVYPVREFSIIGNRGKDGPLEDSSDGVVPYWSSHLERAESEKIVPTDHGAIDHEESVAEIKRILQLP